MKSSNAGRSATPQTRFGKWRFPRIVEGVPTRYTWVVRNKKNFKLGRYTDIGAFTYINARYGVTVGEHVQIGAHCSVYSESSIDDKKGPVVLGENCRIGAHCVVMPGVTVGPNAVVGAFSFINRDIPANARAWGVPVKIQRKS